MAFGPITAWEIDGETVETVSDFIFLGSKITADGNCSHEIKRRLLLGRKVMTNLDSTLKSRDITLPTKICLVKAMVFPVVMYGCESWIINKAERQRTDAFELWCWRRLLRVPFILFCFLFFVTACFVVAVFAENICWDFLGGLLVEDSPSKAAGMGLIPGQRAKISHSPPPRTPEHTQKQCYNKLSKDLKKKKKERKETFANISLLDLISLPFRQNPLCPRLWR